MTTTNKAKSIKYPLASDSWDWREKLSILKVMSKGRYTMGEEVFAFEREFAAKMGSEHAIMVNSGSSANLVGLAALVLSKDIKPGSEVIVPAVSWSTTYFPIKQLGLIPVFVDIDELTFNMSDFATNAAINNNTAAIFAVNLLGMPCHLQWLKQLCHKRGIFLLEDNCESLGAFHYGKPTGTFGIFGTHSFFFSHHLQTMEGGMIVTNDLQLAEYARAIRAHGWVRNLQSDSIYKRGSYSKWEESFKFIVPGYCVRPLEMSGAIGRQQLKKLDKFIEARRENAEVFVKEFSDLNIQVEGLYDHSSWFGFGVVLSTGGREHIIAKLSYHGVETRPIVTGNFLNQPVIKSGYMDPYRIYGKVENAEKLDKNGFFFGNDHRSLQDKIRRVRDIVGII